MLMMFITAALNNDGLLVTRLLTVVTFMISLRDAMLAISSSICQI